MGNVLYMGSHDGCLTLDICWMSLNYILKWLKWCILYPTTTKTELKPLWLLGKSNWREGAGLQRRIAQLRGRERWELTWARGSPETPAQPCTLRFTAAELSQTPAVDYFTLTLNWMWGPAGNKLRLRQGPSWRHVRHSLRTQSWRQSIPKVRL